DHQGLLSEKLGKKVTRKKTHKINVDQLIHTAAVKIKGESRTLRVPITPEGNRFSNYIVAQRFREIIENNLKVYAQNGKGKIVDSEEILRLTRAFAVITDISYRAMGDIKDCPALPDLTPAQNDILSKALPEVYELMQKQDV